MAKIWVVVGDSGRARIFSTNRAAPLLEVETHVNPDVRGKIRDIVSDAPGVTPDRVGYALHAVGTDRDPREVSSQRFARELADRLREAHASGDFERLFLAAPPPFLGILRQALDPSLHDLVVGEVAKDFSRLGPRQIRELLPDLI